MLIIGLGNPGLSYDKTKHNFGFWVLDLLVNRRSLKWESGYGDYVYAKHNNNIFAKPTTFMNNSGLAIKELCQHYNQEDILVVYDDIDLNLGTLRFKSGGGTGGHKGIESIIYQIQSEKFNRLRIGIATEDQMRPAEKYVLNPFRDGQKKIVNDMIEKACEGIEYYLSHDIKETMNQFNEKTKNKGLDE